MKPVDQSIVHKGNGDCHRAAVASLFDLDLDMVPNFIKYDSPTWWQIYCGFIWSLGYEVICFDSKRKEFKLRFYKKYSVGGFFIASVPSKTFKDSSHAVIVNLKGTVVHDPNPNKKWLGKRPKKELHGIYLIEKRKKPRA